MDGTFLESFAQWRDNTISDSDLFMLHLISNRFIANGTERQKRVTKVWKLLGQECCAFAPDKIPRKMRAEARKALAPIREAYDLLSVEVDLMFSGDVPPNIGPLKPATLSDEFTELCRKHCAAGVAAFTRGGTDQNGDCLWTTVEIAHNQHGLDSESALLFELLMGTQRASTQLVNILKRLGFAATEDDTVEEGAA